MRVHYWPNQSSPPVNDRAVAVGAFDGIHLGHQQVINHLLRLSQERKWSSCIVTFEPIPAQVFSTEAPQNLRLTTAAERLDLIERLGIEEVCVVDFAKSSVRAMTAAAFLRDVLVGWLGAAGIVGSHSHTMGSDRKPWPAIAALARESGLVIAEVPPIASSANPVSSTQIRELVWRGRVAEASALMQRDYTLSGRVMSGTGTGRELGFPTLNLALPAEKLLPADGVYAGWATGDSLGNGPLSVRFFASAWPAAVNVGTCPTRGRVRGVPTVDDGERMVEAHVVGWHGEVREGMVTVGLIQRLRDERCFPTLEDLRTQIAHDVAQATEIASRRYTAG
jgi:riboflavin kinase/FMN adenylyltransferase